MEIMNVVEKRDFIHSHLHRANEKTINELYEKLRSEEVLKEKLESRAQKSEKDIQAGRVFSREDIEQRIANPSRK
jgi:septin family protein